MDKLTETDYIVLRGLCKPGYYIHSELSKLLGISKSTLTRSLSRLKTMNLVTERKKGKLKEYNLNRNKKKEVLNMVAIFQSCNYYLTKKGIYLLRIHDNLLHTHIVAIEWKLFPREKYTKYEPNNRVCRTIKIGSLATIILNLNSSTVGIFLVPFYIPYNVYEGSAPHGLPLEEIYESELFKRFLEVKERLKADGIYLSDDFKLLKGSTAILNDPLATVAVKAGFKNNNVDQSVFPIPEYEEHGLISIDKIQAVLNLRQFCIKNNITEYELTKIIQKTPALDISKPYIHDSRVDSTPIR